MTKRKAITTLKEQKEKLLKVEDSRSFILWKTQTLRYVESFLKDGGRSEEINLINSFREFPNIQDANYDERVKNLKDGLSKCLDSIAETIKRIGIPKREWKHVLITTHPAVFWSVFSGVLLASISLAFWAGTFVANSGNKSNNAPHKDTTYKNDSLHI